MGLSLLSYVYTVYVFLTAQFLLQLFEPSEILELELWGLRRFAAGPGNWIQPVEIWNLHTHLGARFRFPSIRVAHLAAKMRVTKFENHHSPTRGISSPSCFPTKTKSCWTGQLGSQMPLSSTF